MTAKRDPRIDPQPGDVLRAKAPKILPGLEIDALRVVAVCGELVALSESYLTVPRWWHQAEFMRHMKDAEVLEIAAPPVDRRSEGGGA